MKFKLMLSVFIGLLGIIHAQKADIRGHVYDKGTGEPLAYASVFLQGTNYGTITDNDGFFNISSIPTGDYTIIATFIGYDTSMAILVLKKNQVINKNFS
ncbi:MAG: carboxypeptidase-like regulatory domain-containing protein, partial [Saprospiraceae bacterium]